MTKFLKEIIRHVVLTDSGTKWPTYDGGTLTRSDFVTASEAANCARRLSFEKQADRDTVTIPDYWDLLSEEDYQARMDAMRDDDKRGIFERGHHMELWVEEKVKMGLLDHEALICTGKNQLSFYIDYPFKVSGTPDGMFLNVNDKTIRFIEVKSTDNPMTSPRASHVSQTQVNMGIVQTLIDEFKLGHVNGWNLNEYVVLGGSILYINPSNYLTMQEFWLDYDHGEALSKAGEKSASLFNGFDDITVPEKLPPEGLEQWGGCTFCGFKSACMLIEDLQKNKATAEKLRALMEGKSPMKKTSLPFFSADARKEDVLRVIADYDAFDKAEKDAAEHKKALRGAIVEWVKTQPDMKVAFEDNGRLFKVVFSTSEREGNVDPDKLKVWLEDQGLDIAVFRKPKTKVENLRINVEVTGV